MTGSAAAILGMLAVGILSNGPVSADAGTSARLIQSAVSGTVQTVERTPVAEAVVTLTGGDPFESSSLVTDDEGRFSFQGLRPGRFSLSASKPGFLTGGVGVTGATGGASIHLGQDQEFVTAITLIKGGVITGIVRTPNGTPLLGVRVFALDAANPRVPSATGGQTGSVTDHHGRYRLHGLAPREYFVLATVAQSVPGELERLQDSEIDRLIRELRTPAGKRQPADAFPLAAMAAIFHPDTSVMSRARRVRLNAGQEQAGVDVVWHSVPVTTIDGQIVGASPTVLRSAELKIFPKDAPQLIGLAFAAPRLLAPPSDDGRFRYSGILPGRYSISVRAKGAHGAGTLFSTVDLEVSASPVIGILLPLSSGSTLKGRVAFENGDRGSASPDGAPMVVLLQSASARANSVVSGTRIGDFAEQYSAAIRPDGTFELRDIAPGTYTIQVKLSAVSGWWLKSVSLNGRNLPDLDVTFGGRADALEATLYMSNLHSTLSGELIAGEGQAASDFFVVVFPVDEGLWSPNSRRFRSTTPASDGTFTFATLPDGDYVVAVLTDLKNGEWQTPSALRESITSGVIVRVKPGEHVVQRLRIGRIHPGLGAARSVARQLMRTRHP